MRAGNRAKMVGVSLLTIATLSTALTEVASATWTQGYDGVSAYTRIGNCPAEDRAGGEYVQNLHDGLAGSAASSGTIYRDNSAWESDLTGSFADTNQFFAFAGHGYFASFFNNGAGAGAHFYTLNSSTDYHTDETDGRANAQWDEIRWGKNQMRWATMYTCRFLANEGSDANEQKIWSMFQGIHLMMGFATRMYLDSREGSWYASRIAINQYTIKDAFFDGASRYQTQLPYSATTSSPQGKVIARVKGYAGSMNDTRFATTARGPAYSNAIASSFSTYQRDITVDGKTLSF